MAEHGAAVALEGIEKDYGSTNVLRDVCLDIEPGEFVSFLGPSGSGKTTTLRIIAGLVEPTRGRLVIRGADMTRVPPHRRNLAMVFQQYALFPHMTVEENVWFGLRMRGVSFRAAAARVSEALKLVRMDEFRSRYPSQLSGGQQQRIGLARCLVVQPAVLLLDEPFGALDRQLRDGMQRELRELQQRLGITTVFVTHDQEEALAISDRIVVMSRGRIEQVGTPEEIYRRPASLFVASFVGTANIWRGRCLESSARATTIEVLGQKLMIGALPVQPGENIVVVVRPENVLPWNGDGNTRDETLTIAGPVKQDVYKGNSRHLVIATNTGEEAIALVPGDTATDRHDNLRLLVPRHDLLVFPDAS
jgi:putative spermidine/putrescine transport system ATP-binding protein